jgi:Membrane bound beta barrel domain (DUF5777)
VIRRASTPRLFLATFTLILTVFGATQTKAQSATPPDDPNVVQASPGSASSTAQQADDAGALDLAEPDFTVVNIPTTLRLPVHKGNFRLTHRFNGNLRSGSFADQLSSLFGIDQGATIGFEYRFGVMRNLQAAVYRSSFDRTIQFYGKYDWVHQSASGAQGTSVLSKLVSISGLASIEGSNNFQERYIPSFGAVVSREIKDRVALYAVPMWVHNSAAILDIDRDTFYVGLGGRARVRPTVYITGEFSPRAAGYAPGQVEYGFGAEIRVGAHVFQATFTNTSGTTFGQIARGGNPDALYFGFNLSRKFF